MANRQVRNSSSEQHCTTGAGAFSRPAFADPDLARQQLERILASSEFIGSDRTRRFLRFVVEQTLAGRADRVKAFSVAVEAFDRDESFDPQTDPIVRIEAGRLRRNLERYYLVAGASDPVRIVIPKGTYVPELSWLREADGDSLKSRDVQPPSIPLPGPEPDVAVAKPWWRQPLPIGVLAMAAVVLPIAAAGAIRWMDSPAPEGTVTVRPDFSLPSVAVLPFDVEGQEWPIDRLSSGMTSEVIRELSQFSSVSVLSPQALQRFGPSPDITVVSAEAGADFALAGSIQQADDMIRVHVTLSDAATGGIIWAESYSRDLAVERVFDLQVDIARDIVRQIAQPQGAIAQFDWKRTRGKAPESWEAYDCVLQAGDLRRRVLPPALAPEIQACLQRAVEDEPDYADAWTMLALVEIDEARFTPLALLPLDSLDPAYAAARRAVELAPDSARAHMAMMTTLFLQGKIEAALAAGQVAVRLNRQDPEILAETGLRNATSGDPEVGLALIQQAVDLSPTVPTWYRAAQSLGLLRKGADKEASAVLDGLEPSPNFVYWSIVAAVRGKAGQPDRARAAADELLKLYPDFPHWAWIEIERRGLAPELASALVEGWRAAGLNVPLWSDAAADP